MLPPLAALPEREAVQSLSLENNSSPVQMNGPHERLFAPSDAVNGFLPLLRASSDHARTDPVHVAWNNRGSLGNTYF